MQVLVTGGYGALGQHVVSRLRAADFKVRVGTRTPQNDGDIAYDLTDAGIARRAVENADVVVHLASQPTRRAADVAGMRILRHAAEAAGVTHLLFVSIVGIDEHPFGYYQAKRAAEQILAAGTIPFTVLRATQFHSFIGRIAEGLAKLGIVPVPRDVTIRPVDAAFVADHIVELVDRGAAGRAPDVGGPEELDLARAIRDYLHTTGRRRPTVGVPIGGATGRAFRRGDIATVEGITGGPTFAEWLHTTRHASGEPPTPVSDSVAESPMRRAT